MAESRADTRPQRATPAHADSALQRDAHRAAALCAAMVRRAAGDAQALERLRAEYARRLILGHDAEARRRVLAVHQNRGLLRALYGEAPYGRMQDWLDTERYAARMVQSLAAQERRALFDANYRTGLARWRDTHPMAACAAPPWITAGMGGEPAAVLAQGGGNFAQLWSFAMEVEARRRRWWEFVRCFKRQDGYADAALALAELVAEAAQKPAG